MEANRTFESDILGNATLKEESLLPFGFTKEAYGYVYRSPLRIPGFSATILIQDGLLYGKVIEDDLDEEFKAFRGDVGTGFAYHVGEAYKELLLSIKESCYSEVSEGGAQAKRVREYIASTYEVEREYLWEDSSFYVFRHNDTKKWFGIIMDIEEAKLKGAGKRKIDVLNVKIDPDDIFKLLGVKGIYSAYHMNKKYWISVVLDDTLADAAVFPLIDRSFSLTSKKK